MSLIIRRYINRGLFLGVLAAGVALPLSCGTKSQVETSNLHNAAREAPVAFEPTQQNKGKRCEYRNYAGLAEADSDTYAECYRLQKDLVDAAMSGDLMQIRTALKHGANIEATY
jgi:hypothetical protein